MVAITALKMARATPAITTRSSTPPPVHLMKSPNAKVERSRGPSLGAPPITAPRGRISAATVISTAQVIARPMRLGASCISSPK